MSNQAVVPRRSRRLATIIPTSLGLVWWVTYSLNDARLMEKLQNDMKKYCDVSENNDVILKGRRGLPYHDLMLPHWKKLFKVLHVTWTNLHKRVYFNWCFSAFSSIRYYVSSVTVNQFRTIWHSQRWIGEG